MIVKEQISAVLFVIGVIHFELNVFIARVIVVQKYVQNSTRFGGNRMEKGVVKVNETKTVSKVCILFHHLLSARYRVFHLSYCYKYTYYINVLHFVYLVQFIMKDGLKRMRL